MTNLSLPGDTTRKSVRLALVGDAGCGKTSLCSTLVSEAFPTTVPSVMHPIVVPPDITPDKIKFTLIDTSSAQSEFDNVKNELRLCDVAAIVCAADQEQSLERIFSHWLPLLSELNPNVPIVLAVNKIDLIDESNRGSITKRFQQLVADFKISNCVECSAKIQIHVPEVFYFAQKSVTHPVAPLFDRSSKTLKKPFIMALTRIFRQCDADMDGKLSSVELDCFQNMCFEVPLKPSDIAIIKRMLGERSESFVVDDCVTLQGFYMLHQLFIERGKVETPWRVLRVFGYDDNLAIREDFLDFSSIISSGDRFELTVDYGLRWLYNLFKQFDVDEDGVLNSAELSSLFFASAAGPPFPPAYGNYVSADSSGSLTLSGWLSQFALLAFFDVRTALTTLVSLGYPAGSVSECVKAIKTGHTASSSRNTLHCIVFGSSKCGKSALLDRLLNKPMALSHRPTQSPHTVANMVDVTDLYEVGDESKFFIVTEVPAIASVVNETIAEDVPFCDLVLLMFDLTDSHSLAYITGLLKSKLPFNVPHIMLAFKSDRPAVEQVDADGDGLDPQDVCAMYDLVALSSGACRKDLGGLFKNLSEAALLPDGFLPTTPAQRQRRKVLRWCRRGLILSVITSAVAIVSVRFNLWGRIRSSFPIEFSEEPVKK